MKRACMQCGTNYQSDTLGTCPDCGAGVTHQLNMEELDVFGRKSKCKTTDHTMPSKYIYRPKTSGLKPEFVLHDTEEFTYIEDYEQSPVIIDYLSFTIRLADLRHCKKESRYSGVHFPEEPVFSTYQAKYYSDIDAYNEYFRKVYTEYLEETLRRFIQYVLGFNYSALRDKGFQFYDDSFVLTSEYGDDYCGQVGIGGNRDTVHFQIPASGCKHLFANKSCRFLHHWLHSVLGVKTLARIDLAFDDYDNLHTCEAAEKACIAGGFKRARGFSPKVRNVDEYQYDGQGNKTFVREERDIGSRQSLVYWRIYNKKLERNITAKNFSWYRSEVELKKFPIDVLLNPLGTFVGLNEYAASLLSENVNPVVHEYKSKKRAACDVLASVYWAKRQYGRLFNSLLALCQGDFEKVVTMLLRDDTVLAYPSLHQKLINALE